MADIEKLALKRDRGYLIRLIVFLALGTFGGALVFDYLTGATVGSCMADVFYTGPKGESK